MPGEGLANGITAHTFTAEWFHRCRASTRDHQDRGARLLIGLAEGITQTETSAHHGAVTGSSRVSAVPVKTLPYLRADHADHRHTFLFALLTAQFFVGGTPGATPQDTIVPLRQCNVIFGQHRSCCPDAEPTTCSHIVCTCRLTMLNQRHVSYERSMRIRISLRRSALSQSCDKCFKRDERVSPPSKKHVN